MGIIGSLFVEYSEKVALWVSLALKAALGMAPTGIVSTVVDLPVPNCNRFLHEAAKVITRRLAIDCGRNMEAQVIMPDVFIDAGKRFEVVKNFS